MPRPTLSRSTSETVCHTLPHRPIHLLLRATSSCHTTTASQCHKTERSYSRPPPVSRPESSSSVSSYETSLTDDSYYGDLQSDEYYTEDSEYDDEVALLDLSDSGFTSVPVPLLAESECCMQIQSLDLSQNILNGEQEEYLTETILLPNLTTLCLEGCKVSSLEPLVRHLRAPNLTELNISQHCLEGSLPQLQRYFPKLETLIARDGLLDQVDESATEGLSLVDLSNNRVSDADGSLCDRCKQQGTELVL